jgi:hypothetical protein
MMKTSGGTIDVVSGLTCGVPNRLIRGGMIDPTTAGAGLLTGDVVNRLMCAGVNGRATTACKIVVAGRTPALGMAPTTCCRMVNAGLTFGAKQVRHRLMWMSQWRSRLDSNQGPSA